MITVTVTTAAEAARVEEAMRYEVMYNCDFNGADYTIVYGEEGSIDGADEYAGRALYAMIFQHRDPELHAL